MGVKERSITDLQGLLFFWNVTNVVRRCYMYLALAWTSSLQTPSARWRHSSHSANRNFCNILNASLSWKASPELRSFWLHQLVTATCTRSFASPCNFIMLLICLYFLQTNWITPKTSLALSRTKYWHCKVDIPAYWVFPVQLPSPFKLNSFHQFNRKKYCVALASHCRSAHFSSMKTCSNGFRLVFQSYTCICNYTGVMLVQARVHVLPVTRYFHLFYSRNYPRFTRFIPKINKSIWMDYPENENFVTNSYMYMYM